MKKKKPKTKQMQANKNWKKNPQTPRNLHCFSFAWYLCVRLNILSLDLSELILKEKRV